MDDGISSRIQEILRDASGRQRPQPVTEAAKQQMLVSTLRLAGHTVSLAPSDPAGGDEAAQADVSTLLDNVAPPPESTLPDDAAQHGDVTPPNETSLAGQPLARNSVYWVNDPTRPADDGKIHLLPAVFDDPTRPANYGKPQTLPFIVGNPTPRSAGELPQPLPLRIHEPYFVPPSAAVGDSSLDSSSDSQLGPVPAGPEDMSPGGAEGFLPQTDSSIDDMPSVVSITSGSNAAVSPNPSVPGATHFPSNPGALSFSFPPIDSEEGGDDGGWDDSTIPTKPADGPTPDASAQLSVDVAPIRSDDIVTEVMQNVIAAIDAKVEQRISDLRHEAFVSRAAWNALFPR